MKKMFLAAALLAASMTAYAVPALADPPADPPGCGLGTGGDDDNDNTGNGCPGQGGNGGNGGGGGQGGGGGNANNSTTNTNTNTNTNVNANANMNTNTNAQQQGQVQGQQQGQVQAQSLNNVNENNSSATGGNASASNTNDNSSSSASSGNATSTNVSYSSSYQQVKQHRNVATAYAPTVVGAGGSDSCLGSISGGGQTGFFGLNLGGTTKDESCRTIKLSRRAEELGMPDVACQILALDPKFNEGLKRAGRSCAISEFAGRMVQIITPTVPVGDAVVPGPIAQPVEPVFGSERGN